MSHSLLYRSVRYHFYVDLFKLLHHMYDSSVAPELIRNTSATRAVGGLA